MQTIIETTSLEPVSFSSVDFPLMVHGRDKSGASLFSIVLAAGLHMKGEKMLIYTAYPMAGEEFRKQIGEKTDRLYVTSNHGEAETASKNQTIIIEPGNTALFQEYLSSLPDISERYILIKNIETIEDGIFDQTFFQHPKLFISGDVSKTTYLSEIMKVAWPTQVLFSEIVEGSENYVAELPKYHAMMISHGSKKIITLKEHGGN